MIRPAFFLAACLSLPALSAPVNYLVVATGNDTAKAKAAIVVNGGTVVADLNAIGVVQASADSANAGFAAAVAATPGILSADADPDINWLPAGEPLVSIDSNPAASGVNSEPLSGLQWNMRQIHANQTAAAGKLGAGAVVAIVDTGLNSQHRDLVDRIDTARSVAFVNSIAGAALPAWEDDVFHGSHVGCIVAASINNFGVQGVAPSARLVAVKVLNSAGSGSFANVIRGIEYAASIGVDVINMSLGATFDRNNAGGNGGGEPFGHFLAALTRAVNHATQSGVLVVSAAGNEAVDLNGRLMSVPAQSGNGVSVSATGPIAQANFDRLASYSNFGASVVNFAAPGGDLVPPAGVVQDLVPSCGNLRAGNPNTFFFAAGTSMATPHVAGVAALLVGQLGHVGAAKLKAIIGNTAADVLPTAQQGRGRVDAGAALR